MMEWLLLGLLIGLTGLGCAVRHRFAFSRLRHPVRQMWRLGWFEEKTSLIQRIASHQRENQSLQKELLTWHHLVQVAPIGFLQVDEDNQLIFCNARACQLLSMDSYNPVKPRLLLELVRSYELDALIEQTRQAQKPCESDWLFHPNDADFTKLTRQQPQPLRGYGIPMPQDCVGVFLESREEPMMLKRQRDRWISDVAHELKTPLTSIRLVAETLIPRLEPPAREWVERLLREAIRLGNLVQDLLDLNQLQAQPNARLTLKPIDLARMIQSAWSSLEPLAREKYLQLDYQGADRVIMLADEARLHRVLLNLLDNSIKFSPTHQYIRVQVGMTPDPRDATVECVHLQVIDAGQGFPEDALPFVFERFYRVDPSRTRQVTNLDSSEPCRDAAPTASNHNWLNSKLASLNMGNGLGLAIVRQIVEAHQGVVTASNHPETGGGWLQVYLPWQPPS